MKLVTREVYEDFVKDLINAQGLETEDAVQSVEQVIDGDGTVRAQAVYFADMDDPQYMIDKQAAWSDTVRHAQAYLEKWSDSTSQLEGISIDD